MKPLLQKRGNNEVISALTINQHGQFHPCDASLAFVRVRGLQSTSADETQAQRSELVVVTQLIKEQIQDQNQGPRDLKIATFALKKVPAPDEPQEDL